MFWASYPRDAVQVAGADALTYLHSQLSQEIRSLSVGQSAWSFLLQPTGKIDVLLRVWRTTDDTFVLDTDAGFGEVMIARLNRFKIRVKAEVEALPWECIAVRGEGVVDSDGLTSWGGGIDLLGAAPEPPVGVHGGSTDDLLAARIAAAWPAMGSEIVPGTTIPAESGVVALAVNFTKGCYPGQELVERMDSRGASAPRLLHRVNVPQGTAVGDHYLIDGIPAGVVTSVHGVNALALVDRRSVVH